MAFSACLKTPNPSSIPHSKTSPPRLIKTDPTQATDRPYIQHSTGCLTDVQVFILGAVVRQSCPY